MKSIYPWRATAITAMVRSTLLVRAASIGRALWMARAPDSWPSIAALPVCSAAAGRTATRCVALRINTLTIPDRPAGWEGHSGDYSIDCLVDELKDEMSCWTYPLNFIDFETSTSALSFYDGRKPYERIAFQF